MYLLDKENFLVSDQYIAYLNKVQMCVMLGIWYIVYGRQFNS